MQFYKIPENLSVELDEFEDDLNRFIKDQSDPVSFKAIRVAHGVYQERQDRACMVRIRCAAGAITPEQLKVVGDLSDQFGSGAIHLTTRQEVQIHGLEITDVMEVLRKLHKAGLSCRGGGGNTVRNILSPADSGIAVAEEFDVEPYALELTSRMIDEPDSWNLPRKVKIVFSNRDGSAAFPEATCLGFAARKQEGTDGFTVYVAGGLGAKPMVGKVLLDFVPAPKAYQVTRALKSMFDKYGNRRNRHKNRIKFLWKKLGEDEFKKLFLHEYDAIKDSNELDLQISESNNINRAVDLQVVTLDDPDFLQWQKRYVKPQKQEDLVSIVIPLKLGNLRATDAILLSNFLKQFGENTLRCSREQNIVLRNINNKYLGNVYHIVKAIDSLSEGPAFIGNMINCNGADACKAGICLAGGLAVELREAFADSEVPVEQVGDFKINISGCINSCGMHQLADLGFAGKVGQKNGKLYPAYRVFTGSKTKAGMLTEFNRNIGTVAARYVTDFVKDILNDYVPQKERFHTFSDFLALEGEELINQLLEKYSNIPSYEDEPEFYHDLGSDEPFSLKDVGKEECSTGMYDIIVVDEKLLRKARIIVPKVEKTKEQDVLYSILFAASRMLLITRGVAAKNDLDVFELFKENFIKTGLVSKDFEKLVQLGISGSASSLIEYKDEVLNLADTVLELYDSLDDSLYFQIEADSDQAADSNNNGIREEDLRGVGCPMNFVRTKMALAGIPSGNRLNVLLDDGLPIKNVPHSVANEGHIIVEKLSRGNYWSVLIEKQ